MPCHLLKHLNFDPLWNVEFLRTVLTTKSLFHLSNISYRLEGIFHKMVVDVCRASYHRLSVLLNAKNMLSIPLLDSGVEIQTYRRWCNNLWIERCCFLFEVWHECNLPALSKPSVSVWGVCLTGSASICCVFNARQETAWHLWRSS